MILISENALTPMKMDALNKFPHECCGFLYGLEEGDLRTITTVMIAKNNSPENLQRRFSISPEDYLNAENYAWESKLSLLGIYHSHPNHPAIPSEHDRLSAQPFFSYVIISVSENYISGMRSWRLNDEQQFYEEQIYQTNSHTIKIKQ